MSSSTVASSVPVQKMSESALADGGQQESKDKDQQDCCVVIDNSGGSYDPATIPASVRLSLHEKTRLRILQDEIPRPKGTLPQNALPYWEVMPLDNKIPYVPAPPNAINLTRGSLNSSLLRATPVFHTDDPHNMRRVPTAVCNYTGLHDPFAKNYYSKPDVRKLLMEHGEERNGQVICTLKDFNRFRLYLTTLHQDQVNEALVERDRIFAAEQEQLRRIRQEERATVAEGNLYKAQEFRRRAKQTQMEKEEHLRLMYEQRRMEDRFRIERICQEKIKRKEELHMKAILERERCAVNLELVRQREEDKKALLLQRIVLKNSISQDKKDSDKDMLASAQRQFVSDWFNEKVECQKQRVDNDEKVSSTLVKQRKDEAAKRQRRVEAYRKALPQIIEEQRHKKERIWEIVRKYAMRWLQKVRAKRALRPDAKHQSIWHLDTVMDDTLKHLRKESGYEKLDDFILSIIKLKREIKAQLEAEEAAEAKSINTTTNTQAHTSDDQTAVDHDKEERKRRLVELASDQPGSKPSSPVMEAEAAEEE